MPLWPIKTQLHNADMRKLTENLSFFFFFFLSFFILFSNPVCVFDHIMSIKFCMGLKFQPNFYFILMPDTTYQPDLSFSQILLLLLYTAGKYLPPLQSCTNSQVQTLSSGADCYSLVFCCWPLSANVSKGDMRYA